MLQKTFVYIFTLIINTVMNGANTKGVEPYELMREYWTWFKNIDPINN
jgi:hypothetical protein